MSSNLAKNGGKKIDADKLVAFLASAKNLLGRTVEAFASIRLFPEFAGAMAA